VRKKNCQVVCSSGGERQLRAIEGAAGTGTGAAQSSQASGQSGPATTGRAASSSNLYVAETKAQQVEVSTGTDGELLGQQSSFAIHPVRSIRQPKNDLTLHWEGGGPMFQVEKAAAITDSFLPVGPAQSERMFTDPGALTTGTQSFYRVRQVGEDSTP
jgi:hypothetical protein